MFCFRVSRRVLEIIITLKKHRSKSGSRYSGWPFELAVKYNFGLVYVKHLWAEDIHINDYDMAVDIVRLIFIPHTLTPFILLARKTLQLVLLSPFSDHCQRVEFIRPLSPSDFSLPMLFRTPPFLTALGHSVAICS